MQTFLPYADFSKCAKVLDNKRIGNQVYHEGLTLIRGGWKNHPASKMWRGHEHALAKYCLALLDELKTRGRDYPKWFKYYQNCLKKFKDTGLPKCVGDERVHSSHRAALLAKNYEHYSQFGWLEKPTINYVWVFE